MKSSSSTMKRNNGTSHKEYVLPTECHVTMIHDIRETPVGMTTPLIHLNPSIFPDPLSFEPERFIEKPRLKRYIMSFSQGSRQCLGMNVAYAELYLVLSGLWRQLSGPETKDEDDSGWIDCMRRIGEMLRWNMTSLYHTARRIPTVSKL